MMAGALGTNLVCATANWAGSPRVQKCLPPDIFSLTTMFARSRHRGARGDLFAEETAGRQSGFRPSIRAPYPQPKVQAAQPEQPHLFQLSHPLETLASQIRIYH